MLALFAAIAAFLAWAVVARFFPAGGLLTRLAAGGATLASAYALMGVLSGRGGIWLAAVRGQRQGT